MKKFEKAKFKRAVSAAEAAKARLSKEVAPKATPSQRAAESMLAKHYREAGLDVKKLAALQKQHAVELRRNDDAQDTAARKRAAKVKSSISSIDSQSKALQLLTERKDFFPYPSVSLDKPFLILGHPNGILWDQSIEPFNSWAKFKVDTTAYRGAQKVSFYFLWSNDSEFYSIINASTFLSATGRIKCTAYGGLLGGTITLPLAQVSAGAEFSLWPWWQHPATPSPPASTVFASPRATADFFDGSRSAAISHGASLDRSLFVVPPNGLVIFEASIYMGYLNDPGRCEGDFQSGSYRITCPVVVVSKLTGGSALVSG